MIVPQNRLIFWVGMVFLPFATIGVILPSALMLSIAIIGILIIVASFDAISARTRLDGISLEFPEVVRMSKNHEGAIDVYVRSNKPKKMRLRIGLAFPQEISADEDMIIELLGDNQVSHFHWNCRPSKRGRYLFDKCYIERASLFGLWAVRSALPAQLEIRVYPDLSFERKNLAALFLNRGSFGIHSQRQVGQGKEFEKLREYIHGDSYDNIHWKATAKRGRPITKVFQIEKTQEVYVIVDASRLSGRNMNILSSPHPLHRRGEGGKRGFSDKARMSSLPDLIGQSRTKELDSRLSPQAIRRGEKTAGMAGKKVFSEQTSMGIEPAKENENPSLLPSPLGGEDKGEGAFSAQTILERFITAALIMGVAAKRQGDLFGVLSFSSRVHSFIRAKSGREHYNNCREALYRLEPQIVAPDFDEICSFIGLRLRRRALLVFLTNLDDPVLAESFVKNMEIIQRKHFILVNMIRPEGLRPLFSNCDAESIGDIYSDLGGHILWHNLLELERKLQRRGVLFSIINNEKICSHLVSQYMNIKQRQII